MGRWSHRAVALAAALSLVATMAGAQQDAEEIHDRHLGIQGPFGDEERVLVTFPRRPDGRLRPPEGRYPLVVALHGAGEAARGPGRGFLGWTLDYQLPRAVGALARGRVGFPDYGGFVTERHLDAVNRGLRDDPWGGVMVVSPYTPNLLNEEPDGNRIGTYAQWVAGPLLAQVRDELPAAARSREHTGIDGVSLGGMLALEIGFRHPEVFRSVGAIQPAIRGRVDHLAELAAGARRAGHEQEIRLLTSEGDPFLEPTRALSERLRELRVPHRLVVLPGPHDYSFNRGPGALELLRFHDQVLDPEPM